MGHFESYYLSAEATGRRNFPVDDEGNSLLHIACHCGKSLDIVQSLVQTYGQDPMVRNNLDNTCADVARHEHHLQIEIYGQEGVDRSLQHQDIIDFFESDALQDF